MRAPTWRRQAEKPGRLPSRQARLRTPGSIVALLAADSMSPVHDKAAFAQAVRQDDFHLLCLFKRHRIEMRIQSRREMLAAALYDTRRLDTLLVIVEALLRRESSHAHVVRSFTVA